MNKTAKFIFQTVVTALVVIVIITIVKNFTS